MYKYICKIRGWYVPLKKFKNSTSFRSHETLSRFFFTHFFYTLQSYSHICPYNKKWKNAKIHIYLILPHFCKVIICLKTWLITQNTHIHNLSSSSSSCPDQHIYLFADIYSKRILCSPWSWFAQIGTYISIMSISCNLSSPPQFTWKRCMKKPNITSLCVVLCYNYIHSTQQFASL